MSPKVTRTPLFGWIAVTAKAREKISIRPLLIGNPAFRLASTALIGGG